MWTYSQTLELGVAFLCGALLALFVAADRKLPSYLRYAAFAIGASCEILGVLVPIYIWNR